MGLKVRWILDDGPLGHLVSIRPTLSQTWEAGVLLVSETTAQAMLQKATPRIQEWSSQLLEPQSASRPPAIQRFAVDLEDVAWPCFREIHGDSMRSTNMAEHESIAWAQIHGGPDTAFVCADKRAALIALAELGCGRVGHPFDVWIDLFERGWLLFEELQRLCNATQAHLKDQLPRIPGRVARHLQPPRPEPGIQQFHSV